MATDLTDALLPLITSWGSSHLIGSFLNDLLFPYYYRDITLVFIQKTVTLFEYMAWSILLSLCADTATRLIACFVFFPHLLRLT